jgi:hypothetical protein
MMCYDCIVTLENREPVADTTGPGCGFAGQGRKPSRIASFDIPLASLMIADVSLRVQMFQPGRLPTSGGRPGCVREKGRLMKKIGELTRSSILLRKHEKRQLQQLSRLRGISQSAVVRELIRKEGEARAESLSKLEALNA